MTNFSKDPKMAILSQLFVGNQEIANLINDRTSVWNWEFDNADTQKIRAIGLLGFDQFSKIPLHLRAISRPSCKKCLKPNQGKSDMEKFRFYDGFATDSPNFIFSWK